MKKEKKTERDSERIIALLLVVWPIILAIVDRVLRELWY